MEIKMSIQGVSASSKTISATGITLIILSVLLLISSTLMLDSDSGKVVIAKELEAKVSYSNEVLKKEVSFPFKYVYTPCIALILIGLILIIARKSILAASKSFSDTFLTKILSVLLIIIGTGILFIISGGYWTALAVFLIFSGALSLFRDCLFKKFPALSNISEKISKGCQEQLATDKKTGFFQKIWSFKLLGPFLKSIIILISIFFSLLFILGLTVISKLDLNENYQPFILIGFALILLFFYAIIRFFPDLLRIFDSIEKNSRTAISQSNPLRFMFLRFSYSALRILAIFMPIILLPYFFWLKTDKYFPNPPLPGLFKWANPVVNILIFIILFVFFTSIILGKKNLKTTLIKHSPFLLFIFVLFILGSKLLISLVILIYTVVNIYKNHNLKRALRLGAVCLLIAILVGSMSLLFEGLHTANEVSLDILGVGHGLNVSLSMLFNYEAWDKSIGYDVNRSGYRDFYNSYGDKWNALKGISEITSKIYVAIPIFLILCAFIMIFLWLVSDLVLTFGQIERNFRIIGRAPPVPSNLHYWIFRISQVLFITALGTFIYLLAQRFFYTNVDTYSSWYKQSGLWESIGTFFINQIKSFSILSFLKCFILAGLLGNIVRLVFDLENYTKGKNKKQGLHFFALNAYTLLIYVITIVFSIVLVFSFFHIANLGEDFLYSVRFNTSWHIGATSALIKAIGIISAFFAFFILTFFASLGLRLLGLEKNLRPDETNVKPGKFFGVKFYIYVTKTIAAIGAIAIIVIPNVFLVRYEKLAVPANIVLFLAALGFYILTAALPDLCFVLLKIEQHVRQGFKPKVIPEVSKLDRAKEFYQKDDYRNAFSELRAVKELNRLLVSSPEKTEWIDDNFTKMIEQNKGDLKLLNSIQSFLATINRSDKFAGDIKKYEHEEKLRRITDLDRALQQAKQNKQPLKERIILAKLIKLGETQHKERAHELNQSIASKIKKPAKYLILSIVVIVIMTILFRVGKDLLFKSAIPENINVANYKSRVDNSIDLSKYFDRDFLIENGIGVQRQEDSVYDNKAGMAEISDYLDGIGLNTSKEGKYQLDDIVTIFIDHFDDLDVGRKEYSDVFMLAYRAGDWSKHYAYNEKYGILGYCFYNYASGWITFSLLNDETPEELAAERERLASRVTPDILKDIFRENLSTEESDNYLDVGPGNLIQGSFSKKEIIEGIVYIYDQNQSHAEGYAELWLMRFENSWKPVRQIYDMDNLNYEIIDVDKDGLSEIMVMGTGGNMGEMFEFTTLFSLKGDSNKELFSASGHYYQNEHESHEIKLEDIDSDDILEVIDNYSEQFENEYGEIVEKEAIYTYKLTGGTYELVDTQELTAGTEEYLPSGTEKHDIDNNRSVLIQKAESNPDKRKLYLITDQNQVIKNLDQEFSIETNFSNFIPLDFPGSIELIHFSADDGDWHVHYYWDLSNNELYYISEEIKSDKIYESKNLKTENSLIKLIKNHYDSHFRKKDD